ncbi:MAG: hypothetical protein ACLP1Y_09340 [Candidatus Acidiferrales bacterium]
MNHFDEQANEQMRQQGFNPGEMTMGKGKDKKKKRKARRTPKTRTAAPKPQGNTAERPSDATTGSEPAGDPAAQGE